MKKARQNPPDVEYIPREVWETAEKEQASRLPGNDSQQLAISPAGQLGLVALATVVELMKRSDVVRPQMAEKWKKALLEAACRKRT